MGVPAQQTQHHVCPVSTRHLYDFMQCWTNVEDVGPTLYKCYTNVLCLLGGSIQDQIQRRWHNIKTKSNKSNGPAPQQARHTDKCRVSAGPASATPNHERPTLEPRFIDYGMEGNIDLMSDVYI